MNSVDAIEGTKRESFLRSMLLIVCAFELPQPSCQGFLEVFHNGRVRIEETSSYTRNKSFAVSSLPAETKALPTDGQTDRRTLL